MSSWCREKWGNFLKHKFVTSGWRPTCHFKLSSVLNKDIADEEQTTWRWVMNQLHYFVRAFPCIKSPMDGIITAFSLWLVTSLTPPTCNTPPIFLGHLWLRLLYLLLLWFSSEALSISPRVLINEVNFVGKSMSSIMNFNNLHWV